MSVLSNNKKTIEIVDCNLFNRIYWLADVHHNYGLSFYWTFNDHNKECMRTINDNRRYKPIQLSKCTNFANERKLIKFLP